jgi:serine protease Do
MMNDPFLRRFFGPDMEQRGNHTMTRKEQSLGSGVIVSPDGYILTANHVIDGADEIKVALASGGKEFTAKVIGSDPPTDIGVLKISAQDLPAITIADSDKLEVGDVVLAIGNPFNVGQTVTMGIISALGRSSLELNQYENFIQTDAAINLGNSGGALVDAEGRLVGINSAIFTTTRGYQGVGFAIPVNLARSIMERLIKFGTVTRGYLGVSLQPEITPDLQEEFALPDTRGAMVGGVQPNTPAARAGLQTGDVIREVEGKPIKDSQQLRLMISLMAPSTRVTLAILRSEPGKKPVEKTIPVTLGTLPEELASRNPRNAPTEQAPQPQDSLEGVEVADIDASVRQQFNLPPNLKGAVVTNVEEDSSVAEAGVRPGDVIQEIDRHKVNHADDAVRLSKKSNKSRVLLQVWSSGGSRLIVVNNSEHK